MTNTPPPGQTLVERKLKQLGVPHDAAVPHGTSRKAYWRLAKTLGGHMSMTRQWLPD